MSWTHADFEEQTTPAARLAKLRQHLTEVQTAISADVSASGRSRSSGSLTQYKSMLDARRKELELETGDNAATRASIATANFRRVSGSR